MLLWQTSLAWVVSCASSLGLLVGCASSLELDAPDTASPASGPGCGASLAPHDIQGSGDTSPREGERLSVAGVVSLAADRGGGAPGFFLQSLQEDDDTQSSEGLFVVFDAPPPAPGSHVSVLGVVLEHEGETRLDAVERLTACGSAPWAARRIGAAELGAPEALEHMWVEAHADWTVLDVSADSLRSGALRSSPLGRQFASGHELGARSLERQAAGAAFWWLEPAGAAGGIEPDSLPRRGARASTLSGVVRMAGGVPRLLLPAAVRWAATVPAAPARPAPGGVRVLSLNLHDYFVSGSGRGARSAAELERQRAKLVAALAAVDADVLALTELENAGSSSLSHLLAGLGAAAPGSYAFLEEPPPAGSEQRAAIVYRSQRVQPSGPAWFEAEPGFRRPPLFQSFEASGGPWALGVVHFKSKRCGDDPRVVPAEGCGEDTRRAEAELLLERLRGLRRDRPLTPLLVLGDLNSDPLEGAPQALLRGGLVDLLGALPSSDRYSFVFEARASLLDHAFGTPDLAARLRAAAIWHINADEAEFRDYSLDNPPDAYVADARRSSDHDPVIVDLDL